MTYLWDWARTRTSIQYCFHFYFPKDLWRQVFSIFAVFPKKLYKGVKNYLKLNDKYLKEGDALLEKADYVQASEKFWGAAAEVIKAITAKREVDIRSHGEIHRFITIVLYFTSSSTIVL